MSANKKTSKIKTRMDLLYQLVKDGFKQSSKIPTAGQIMAYLKEQHRKRIEYNTARALQLRLKRAYAKKPLPANVSDPVQESALAGMLIKPEEQPKPVGQMRYSHSHGM